MGRMMLRGREWKDSLTVSPPEPDGPFVLVSSGFSVTLWDAVIMSAFSSVLSLSPFHAQLRGTLGQGARDALSGWGWGKGWVGRCWGRRCQSSYQLRACDPDHECGEGDV